MASSTTRRPRVFVGSSSEGHPLALAVQQNLAEHAECEVWDQNVFAPSELTLEGLERASRQHDFAVLVVTADDVVEVRGERSAAARDNILFEVGFFIGALGRLRTYLMCPADLSVRLPTDLLGLTAARYLSGACNLRAVMAPACAQIAAAMAQRGLRRETIVPVAAGAAPCPLPRPQRRRSLGTGRAKGPLDPMPIVNISLTGALLKTSGELAIGTPLDLALELDNHAVVHAKADVVRVQTPDWKHIGGVGVHFTEVDPASREALEAFVGHAWDMPLAQTAAPRRATTSVGV